MEEFSVPASINIVRVYVLGNLKAAIADSKDGHSEGEDGRIDVFSESVRVASTEPG